MFFSGYWRSFVYSIQDEVGPAAVSAIVVAWRLETGLTDKLFHRYFGTDTVSDLQIIQLSHAV